MYFALARRRGRRRGENYHYFTTSRCSRGVRETKEEAGATKDGSMDYQSKQAILPRSLPLLFCPEEYLVACTVWLFFSLCLSAFYCCIFSCHVRNFPTQVRRAIGAIGMYQMRELLYQGRSVHRYLDLH